jgi:hypothetical protein
LATCTRGTNPPARTQSKTCWRKGRACNESGGTKGPTPWRAAVLAGLIWRTDIYFSYKVKIPVFWLKMLHLHAAPQR